MLLGAGRVPNNTVACVCVCVYVCVRSVRGTTWVNAWTGVRTPLGLGEAVPAAATRVCAVVGAVGRLLWTCMLVCHHYCVLTALSRHVGFMPLRFCACV